jgi:hypothetical protein
LLITMVSYLMQCVDIEVVCVANDELNWLEFEVGSFWYRARLRGLALASKSWPRGFGRFLAKI